MKYYFQQALYGLKRWTHQTSSLEELIKVPIVKSDLFIQCFTHGGETKNSYDRLEFLGDAVLQSIVSEYLFREFPMMPEGQLTQMRSRLVRRQALNVLGFKIGLGKYIQSDYLKFESINEENKRIYGDTLEALIGAIYLNSGYRGARKFVTRELIKPFVKQDYLVNEITNYKGHLQQLSQKHHFNIAYQSENKPGNRVLVSLKINDKVFDQVLAKNKKKAEQILAKRFVLNSQNKLNQFIDEEE